MKKFIYLTLCILFLPFSGYTAQNITLQNRFEKGSPGDFIVTAQEGVYTVLILRHREKSQLILEEISIPQAQLEIKKIQWQDWLKEKAPGHTSWSLFEIDLEQGKLVESYSINKQSWLYIDSSEFLLSKLLKLPLSKVGKEDRKKIGPPPLSGQDFRSIWNPPLVFFGKALKKPSFEVYQGKWPHDQSIIEDCFIDFYFSSFDPLFPFPHWLEIQSAHYTLTIRAIDSGKGLLSPVKGTIPHRLPSITSATKRSPEMWTIPIQAPIYCHTFKLYAIESNEPSHPAVLIPFQLRPGAGEELFMDISSEVLSNLLKKGSYYRWVLIPASENSVQIQSGENFLWE